MGFWLALLIGLGVGLVVFPIIAVIYTIFKVTLMRRNIKKLLKQGRFLIPIDQKDYDVKAWQNKKYANINPDDYKKDLEDLNLKIFKKVKIQEDNPFEHKKNDLPDNFIITAKGYLEKARMLGYSDEFIVSEFKKKNYPDYLISEIMGVQWKKQ